MGSEHLITRQVEEYITYKRSLGYKISVEADELKRFAAFARKINHEGALTSELAMQWASLNSAYSRFYMARRLETVHTFAKYVSTFDPLAQIPQLGVFGKCHGRSKPYIYTDIEVSLLMTEAAKLFSPDGIRAYTVPTAIGLLRATGLRISELTLLKIEDVHLDEGYLFINSSKFKKERIVPLHATVTEALAKYRGFITKKLGQRSGSESFFVSSYGQKFSTRSFEYAFQQIRPVLYTNPSFDESRKIRLYDFRHTFACDTIRRLLKTGEDINHKLYLLSTYMGHSKPEDTYWYLSATPELLAISCERYESAFGLALSPTGEEVTA
jgi:site-specific recombinase XerD